MSSLIGAGSVKTLSCRLRDGNDIIFRLVHLFRDSIKRRARRKFPVPELSRGGAAVVLSIYMGFIWNVRWEYMSLRSSCFQLNFVGFQALLVSVKEMLFVLERLLPHIERITWLPELLPSLLALIVTRMKETVPMTRKTDMTRSCKNIQDFVRIDRVPGVRNRSRVLQ